MKKATHYFFALAALLLIAPAALLAQTIAPTQTQSGGGFNTSTLQSLFTSLIAFINTILVPLVFALAFFLFLFGVFRYFFSSGAKADEGRTEGKKFIMWGVIALAVMISVWGLVNILVRTFGFQNETTPCLPTFSGKCNKNPSSSSNEPQIPGTGLDGIY